MTHFQVSKIKLCISYIYDTAIIRGKLFCLPPNNFYVKLHKISQVTLKQYQFRMQYFI